MACIPVGDLKQGSEKVAALLAAQGSSVLAVDWDLEAPGLDWFV